MLKDQNFIILGFVIDFVSGPVSSGFTSAVALIIVTSQVKDLLGIGKYVKGNTFVEMWTDIINNFDKVRYADTLLGIGCITVLLLLRVRRGSLTHAFFLLT
jgi:solute carrier family 26 (sodium-independent sulfate anion transporter), member 11